MRKSRLYLKRYWAWSPAAIGAMGLGLMGARAAAFTPHAIPERQSTVIEAACSETTFELRVDTNGNGFSELRYVKVDGEELHNRSTQALSTFLAAIRLGRVSEISCVSSLAFQVAVSGSRLSVNQGEDDDVTEWFQVNFDVH